MTKKETRHTITFSNGEKITATDAMFNDMAIAFSECASKQLSFRCEFLAEENSKMAQEIYDYLESKGYYD